MDYARDVIPEPADICEVLDEMMTEVRYLKKLLKLSIEYHNPEMIKLRKKRMEVSSVISDMIQNSREREEKPSELINGV